MSKRFFFVLFGIIVLVSITTGILFHPPNFAPIVEAQETIILEPGEPIPFPRDTGLVDKTANFFQFIAVLAVLYLPLIIAVSALPLLIVTILIFVIWNRWKKKKDSSNRQSP